MPTASPSQHRFAAALLDASLPVPPGLCTWNGSDPARRFAVHRNNVVHSLVGVLGDTFPVVKQLVGDTFFGAMAQRFIAAQPPASPLMHRYGEGLAAWLTGFEPARELPYLADMARLEFARLRAWHAADATAIETRTLAAALADPERLAAASFVLHPSLTVLRSVHPVVSLWCAHQHEDAVRDALLAATDLAAGEAGLVFRLDDDAFVLALPLADAGLAAALAAGQALGPAQAAHADADLGRLVSVLLQHGLVAGIDWPTRSTPAVPETAR